MKEAPIICLASWYPNEIDFFEGDFIQRKLKALSFYRPVQVLHLKKCTHEKWNKKISKNQMGLLEETIYYKKGGSGIFNQIKNYWYSFKIHNIFLKNYISTFGQPKAILVQVPYNAGIIALYWKKKYGIDYILTEHYGIYNDRYELNYSTRSSIYKFIVKQIIKNAKKFITVSHSLASDIEKIVIKKEYTKISNVVDTNLFQHKVKPQTDPFIFCHLSNMIPVKNIPGIIRAAKTLADQNINFKLNLIGGENIPQQKLAEELNLKDKFIFFQPPIPYEQVAKELQRSHALIMFSNTESQSCISLEALCTGTPVISSRAGGIEEHLDESNSILVELKDEEALARSMLEMIRNYDRFNQEEIAFKNQALWNYNQIGKEYNQLIKDVLSQ